MPAQELSHSVDHRGCGIRAASYSVGPETWLPEACVWLRTDSGLRRIWVHSFAHCFDAEKLTFPNKVDADGWELVAGKIIIDRALEQVKSVVSADHAESSEAAVRGWRLAFHALRALRRFRSARPIR